MPPISKKFGSHIGLGLSVRLSGFTNEHILVTLHVLWTNVGYICAIGYPILGMLNYLSEIAFMTHWLQCQISFFYPK